MVFDFIGYDCQSKNFPKSPEKYSESHLFSSLSPSFSEGSVIPPSQNSVHSSPAASPKMPLSLDFCIPSSAELAQIEIRSSSSLFPGLSGSVDCIEFAINDAANQKVVIQKLTETFSQKLKHKSQILAAKTPPKQKTSSLPIDSAILPSEQAAKATSSASSSVEPSPSSSSVLPQLQRLSEQVTVEQQSAMKQAAKKQAEIQKLAESLSQRLKQKSEIIAATTSPKRRKKTLTLPIDSAIVPSKQAATTTSSASSSAKSSPSSSSLSELPLELLHPGEQIIKLRKLPRKKFNELIIGIIRKNNNRKKSSPPRATTQRKTPAKASTKVSADQVNVEKIPEKYNFLKIDGKFRCHLCDREYLRKQGLERRIIQAKKLNTNVKYVKVVI